MSAVFDGLVCCSGFCGIGLCPAVLAKPLNNGTLEVELYAVVFEQVAGKRRRHAFNFAAAQMKEPPETFKFAEALFEFRRELFDGQLHVFRNRAGVAGAIFDAC